VNDNDICGFNIRDWERERQRGRMIERKNLCVWVGGW